MVETGTRLCRPEGAVHRQTLAGALVLVPGDTEPALLTGPGADVWELLEDGITQEELVAELAERYHVDRERVATDIVPLLDQLAERGMVVHSS